MEIEIEVRTPSSDFSIEELDEGEIKIEFDLDAGIPNKGEATLSTHIEGCGEVTVETRFEIEEEEGYVTEETIGFDNEGTPFEREVNLEVEEVEILEMVVCGIDLLGEILGDGEVTGVISVAQLFEPLSD